tara:strand:- start:30 stop:1208 length:1179 start_codon:yes stop_codon:yes gene_type:complete
MAWPSEHLLQTPNAFLHPLHQFFVMTYRITRATLLCACALAPASAHAALGIFTHGNGIKSLGMGGVSYSIAEESMALAANPAHAAGLGKRIDVAVDVFGPQSNARIYGNAAGPDMRYRTDAKRAYMIPQGGFNLPLTEKLSFGLTLLSAGLGPDYPDSPYQRFGGATRTNIQLASTSMVSALAYQLAPKLVVGLSANLGYQQLRLQGINFLSAISERPGKVSNQGKDGSASAGYSVGMVGELTPQLRFGMAYRSKSWTGRHTDYSGLLPERGRLELPAIWGAGFTATPLPQLEIALEYQRYEYANEPAFANRLGALAAGHLLGSSEGPGFGFKDQSAYKLGVQWQATSQLTLRGGYISASQVMRESENLFGILGTLPTTTHYTAGASYVAAH